MPTFFCQYEDLSKGPCPRFHTSKARCQKHMMRDHRLRKLDPRVLSVTASVLPEPLPEDPWTCDLCAEVILVREKVNHTKGCSKRKNLDKNMDQALVGPVRKRRITAQELARRRKESIESQLREDGGQDPDVLYKRKVSKVKGDGLYSKRGYLAGEVVVEYKAKLLRGKEAAGKEAEYMEEDELGCYMFFAVQRGHKIVLDATVDDGSKGRMANHSRTAPNLVPKMFEVDGVPRLVLLAASDIKPSTELKYDYEERRPEIMQRFPWLKQ